VKTSTPSWSVYSDEPDTTDAAQEVAESLLEKFGEGGLKAVLVYATMNHDQEELVRALRDALGEDVLLLGSSAQGVVSNDELTEDGFAITAMGFGGDALQCSSAFERDVAEDPHGKGRHLAESLVKGLDRPPAVVLISYDPLCGIDVQGMLKGMSEVVDCPFVGGAAGQPWGPPRQTFQYWGGEVFSHGAVALALAGDFNVEVGICHGTDPTGIKSVVTKSDGNRVIEIDGRPAAEVWRETTGCRVEDMVQQSHLAAWAVAVEVKGKDGASESAIRGAFGFESDTGAMLLQAPVAEGTNVVLQHRTVEKVLTGTQTMARELNDKLAGRKPWAVVGFECGARTFPFLGEANTRAEHQQLRAALAPDTPWLGMMAWGEVGPCAGTNAFHNYTYPLLVLTE
jgi:hypothetical protein